MKLFRSFVIGIFIISLLAFLFSGYQIINAKSQFKKGLQAWDEMKSSSHWEESPLSIIDPQLFQGQGTDQSFQSDQHDPTQRANPAGISHLQSGDLMGKLIIPTLQKEYPIYYGTDDQTLANGIGHYIGSAFPGQNDHAVLAGHRDTVFTQLGKVEIGSEIVIETIYGVFTYIVERQQIVASDDRTIIVPSDEAIVSLITCYPFDFIGSAPDRYIVTAKLLETH